MKRQLFGVLVGLLSISSYGRDRGSLQLPSLAKLRAMNGIDPKHYQKFWEKWDLVSVRFREDNRELRFVYANKIAYNALIHKKNKFPDGSALGKVAFKTQEDASFPNSVAPSNFSRMQLMVKNSKKFSSSDGWSYWLYLDKDNLSPKKDRQRLQACHACHTIVKDKDFVFTTPTFLGKISDQMKNQGGRFQDEFQDESTLTLTNLERALRGLLLYPDRSLNVQRLKLFSGSQYESIGPLAKFADSHNSYLLIDPDSGKFLLAEQIPSQKGCKKRVRVLLHKKLKKNVPLQKRTIFKHGVVCDGKNQWIDEILPSKKIRQYY